MGYNVYMFEHVPIGTGLMNQLNKDVEKHWDQFYTYKKNATGLDVGIFNILSIVII